MKKILNITVGFLMLGIVGSMECNSMSIKDGLITLVLLVLFLCLINRKKSATSRPRNGQVRYKHTDIMYKNCTPCKGGLSSVYKGICCESGKTVPDGMALGYALSRVLEDENQKEEFIDWFYSGNWVKVEEDEE